ncbi:MAG: hypothetical protein N2422_05215 [Rhodobacteraceae bacterium]|nr:hypothetical protein [Paracoccaceae bacterium]
MSDETAGPVAPEPRPAGPAATAGIAVLGGAPGRSPFALLRQAGLDPLEAEPAPKQVSAGLAARFHYGASSVRAGELGEVRAVAQLVAQALGGALPRHVFWPQPDGTVIDGLRAAVEPCGLPDRAQAEAYRRAHLAATADVLRRAATVVLPLWRVAALADAADGTIYPPAPPGVALPKGLRLAPAPETEEALDAGFAALRAGLLAARPGAVIRIVLADAGAGGTAGEVPAPLRAAAARWAACGDGVVHDPVLDHLVARHAALPPDHPDRARIAAAVARLVGGEDILDLIQPSGAASVAPTGGTEAAGADAPRRRAGKPGRGGRRGRKARQAEARIVCEDELLEAFS